MLWVTIAWLVIARNSERNINEYDEILQALEIKKRAEDELTYHMCIVDDVTNSSHAKDNFEIRIDELKRVLGLKAK